MEPSLIYIPVKFKNNDTVNQIKKLIEYLLTKIDLEDESAVVLSHKIFNLSKKETLILHDILELLEQNNNKIIEIEDEIINESIEVKKQNDSIPTIYSRTFIIITVLFEMLVVLIISLIIISFNLNTVSALGLIIAVGVLDLLILKKIFKKDKVEQKLDKIYENSGHIEEVLNENRVVNNEIHKILKMDTEILSNEISATEILGLKDIQPYLFRMDSGIKHKIDVNKNPFIIGKLKSQVDFAIQDNTISRIHAEIVKEEGQYYVKDLNSKNGTYLNTEKIDSNQIYLLKNDDKVAFSNCEYIFKEE